MWTANDWMALGAMITAGSALGGFTLWVAGHIRKALYAGAKTALEKELGPASELLQKSARQVDIQQRVITVVFVISGGAAILASLLSGKKSLS